MPTQIQTFDLRRQAGANGFANEGFEVGFRIKLHRIDHIFQIQTILRIALHAQATGEEQGVRIFIAGGEQQEIIQLATDMYFRRTL